MKSISDNRPDVFQNLGNGSYYYNRNIQEKEETLPDGSIHHYFEYDSTLFWGEPEYDTVVKACIREETDETQEFALVNAYNAYKLELTDDPQAEEEYKTFLNHVAAIKQQVRWDIEQNL